MRRILFLALMFAAAVAAPFAAGAQTAAPPENLTGQAAVERFAQWWVGSWSNERQTRADVLAREPDWPESVRLLRDLRVTRLEAPAIAPLVLYLEEVKADQPDKVHRKRVMTFDWKAETQEVHVRQHFFAATLHYDQPFRAAAAVAAMKRADFTLQPGCDLFVRWEAARQRFKGGMRPRACQYDHPGSGQVYAEYDMVLERDRLWYRDRSIKTPSGEIRGEIDGFSWLRFDRLADVPDLGGGDRISKAQMVARMPLTARMEGIWEGTFRRYDAAGKLVDTLPSRIIVRFLPDGAAHDYHQTNILMPPGKPEQRIESFGKWDVDRLRFANQRLEGWAQDVAADASGLTSVFVMAYTDGSGLTVSEVISLSPDGKRRMRATQYIKNGVLERRTLIDEAKAGD